LLVPTLILLALASGAPLRSQELLPLERTALAERAAGRPLAAAASLLAQAEAIAAVAGNDDLAARVEALATQAARLATGHADAAFLQRFDALRRTPLARTDALLDDRLAVAALGMAVRVPEAAIETRARALGAVREFWLLGPFNNERGAGYGEPLAPEQRPDLAASHAGKRREIGWRHVALSGRRLELPLHTLLTPHEQSLAYLAVALLADRPGEAVLELGSTGSVRAFLNGAEVFARDVERELHIDQDAVAVPLQQGPNLLLLKVCHQDGPEFAFTLRCRSRSGAPLTTVRSSAARADVEAAIAAAARSTAAGSTAAAPLPAPALGGRSNWSLDGTRGADALRLCWLWRARAADGDLDRRDTAAARAAVRELPNEPEAWLQLAGTLMRPARSAADRDDNERRRALEQALALAPDHVDALVQLGELLQQSARLWRPARELADRALQRAPDHDEALLLRGATLREQGLGALAAAELQRAAAAPAASPRLLHRAADALSETQPAAARALLQRLRERIRFPGDSGPLAAQLARTGDTPAAIALLRTALDEDPLDHGARLQLAALLLQQQQPRAAVDLLQAWLAVQPDDARALVLQARGWRQLIGEEPAAAEALEATLRDALAVEPTRRHEERYAEFLASKGDQANAFYTEYRVDPAALVAQDNGPPADAVAANDPLHWLLRQTVVRANGNGTTNVYQQLIVAVLNQDGARALQFYRLPYYSGEQRARLLACSVFQKDGTVQRPALQGASVRLPDLRPGDIVAIEGRIDDLGPSFFGDYFGYEHTFAGPDGSPLRRSELVLLAEPGRDYRVQAIHGAPEPRRDTLAEGTLRFRWRMDELGRATEELRAPAGKEFEPLVRVTTYRDWDQFAAWWWNLIQKQLEVTPQMRATVERLCAGLPTVEHKIAALYHFVTTDVRYEAWEFGVHGYKPYSTAIIHERRHGDCKDKALLLCALLGEIGVPCHPVLIFADAVRSRDDLALPMVQHFNHCIAWIPPQGDKPARFLDGTAVWHPSDTLPEMDQGARVLVVERGKARLLEVPWTTPEYNVTSTEYTLQLQAAGGAKLQLLDAPRGNRAVELRAMLATEPLRQREVVERQLVALFGKAELQQLVAAPPPDPEANVQLRAEALLPELGRRDGDRWQLPSAFGDNDLLGLAADAERRHPLLLGAPSAEQQTLRYRLPAGWRSGALPSPTTVTAPFGSFTMTWRLDDDSLVVERDLRLEQPRIAVADYPAFRDFLLTVKSACGQLVLLQRETGR
jgi:hypothetical protein